MLEEKKHVCPSEPGYDRFRCKRSLFCVLHHLIYCILPLNSNCFRAIITTNGLRAEFSKHEYYHNNFHNLTKQGLSLKGETN